MIELSKKQRLSQEFYSLVEKNLNEFQLNLESTIRKSKDELYAFNEFKNNFYKSFDIDRERKSHYFDIFRNAAHQMKLDKTAELFNLIAENYEDYQLDSGTVLLLADIKAKLDFSDYLRNYNFKSSEIDEAQSEYIFQWASNFNQIDFIKLIYALHECGYIKGHKTKNIKEIAKRLNFPLNDQYNSILSDAIHNRNKDFELTIFFDDLKKAFKDYETSIFEKKANKTKNN